MTDVFGKHQPKIPYRPIADLLAAYRQRDPDKLAIVDLDQETSISFGALDAAVTEVAAALRGKGVGKGSRVLLLSDENLEKLLIWLAIWRLGAVVAPLNIELNESIDRRARGNCRSGARAGAQGARRQDAAGGKAVHQVRQLLAERGRCRRAGRFLPHHAARHRAGEPARSATRADDIACIFCTSGTTSRPKLVVYDHCAYWLNGLSTLEALGLNEDDRTLEYRSFGWNSAQVVSLMPFLEEGPDDAHRPAVLAQPLLRLDPDARHHVCRGHSHGRQHAAEQAARLHRRRTCRPCG